jgi:hypothetical protein
LKLPAAKVRRTGGFEKETPHTPVTIQNVTIRFEAISGYCVRN